MDEETTYQVGDLTAFEISDPVFPDEDAARSKAVEIYDARPYEQCALGVWRNEPGFLPDLIAIYADNAWFVKR